MDIRIGTKCSCSLSFLTENGYGKYCYKDQIIGLGRFANEIVIFAVLNHETLHGIIAEIMDENTAKLFDKTFLDGRWKFLRITLDDGTPKF